MNNFILPYMKLNCKKYFINIDVNEYINLNNKFINKIIATHINGNIDILINMIKDYYNLDQIIIIESIKNDIIKNNTLKRFQNAYVWLPKRICKIKKNRTDACM